VRTLRTHLVWAVFLLAAISSAACSQRDHALTEPEYVDIVVGNAAPGESVPLIFGIHGRGDRPEMFARLFASEFPVPARLVFPRGLSPEGRGFSWFQIADAGSIAGRETAEGVRDAGERIAVLIARLAQEHSAAAKPVVFGYSQGGMLSFYLASHHPDLIAAAVPLSGFLPQSLLQETPAPAPTYAFHGVSDELIPVEAARATVRAFTERGGTATLVEYPHVGHQITVAVMRAARHKLVELTAPSS
jgi:phospholipase/carboxylesterase